MYTTKAGTRVFPHAEYISVLLPPESSLLGLPGEIQTQEKAVYEVMRETIKTKVSRSSLSRDPEEERKYARHV